MRRRTELRADGRGVERMMQRHSKLLTSGKSLTRVKSSSFPPLNVSERDGGESGLGHVLARGDVMPP